MAVPWVWAFGGSLTPFCCLLAVRLLALLSWVISNAPTKREIGDGNRQDKIPQSSAFIPRPSHLYWIKASQIAISLWLVYRVLEKLILTIIFVPVFLLPFGRRECLDYQWLVDLSITKQLNSIIINCTYVLENHSGPSVQKMQGFKEDRSQGDGVGVWGSAGSRWDWPALRWDSSLSLLRMTDNVLNESFAGSVLRVLYTFCTLLYPFQRWRTKFRGLQFLSQGHAGKIRSEQIFQSLLFYSAFLEAGLIMTVRNEFFIHYQLYARYYSRGWGQ
jgi:hypothetical protein